MPPNPPHASGSPAGLRRLGWLRWPLALLALVLLLRLALPGVLHLALERQGSQALGAALEVEDVDLGLLSGDVAVHGLRIVTDRRYLEDREPSTAADGTEAGPASGEEAEGAEAGAKPAADPAMGMESAAPQAGAPQELLRIDRIAGDLEWSALLQGRIALASLELDAPRLRLSRAPDGSIRALPSGPDAGEEPEPETEAESDGGGWPVSIASIALHDLEARLVDATEPPTELVDLKLDRFALSSLEMDALGVRLGDATFGDSALRVRRAALFPPPGADGGAEEGPSPQAGADTASERPGSDAGDADAAGFQLDYVVLEGSSFTLLGGGDPLELEVQATAEAVRLDGASPFPIQVTVRTGGGELVVAGELGLAPLDFAGRVRWSDLGLPPLSVAIDPDLAAWIETAEASGDVEVDLRLGDAAEGAEPGIDLKGRAEVRNLAMADPEGGRSLAWKRSQVVIREAFFPLGPEGRGGAGRRVELERVHVEEPDVTWIVQPEPAAPEDAAPSDPEETAAGDVESAPEAENAAGEDAAPPVVVTLDAFELVGGHLRFRDPTVSPPVETEVHDLHVEGADLRWPDPRGQALAVRAGLPEGSSMVVRGDAQEGHAQATLELRRLPLEPWSPYAARAAGYRIDAGTASLETTFTLRDGRIEADNALDLHGLGITAGEGDWFSKTFGVPVELGLALLRDIRGDIHLSVPVSGPADQVRTGLASVLVSALRSALTGALSSPLKVVGAVIPGGDGTALPKLEPLRAQPGQVSLVADDEPRVGSLARLLESHPDLQVALRGRAGKADRAPLAREKLAESVRASEGLPAVAGEGDGEEADAGWLQRRRIESALEEGSVPALGAEDRAVLDGWVEATKVAGEALDELARARAQDVRDALVARGVTADRIQVGDPARGRPGVVFRFTAAETQATTPVAAPAEPDQAEPSGS